MALTIYNENISKEIDRAMATLLKSRKIRAFILTGKGCSKKIGYILFNSRFIRFLCLSGELTEMKIPAFLLTRAAVKRMWEEDSEYIVSFFPRMRKILGVDNFSPCPPLLDFFKFLEFQLKMEIGSEKDLSRFKADIPETLSLYSFQLEEHNEMILKLAAEYPDPFIKKLLPRRETRKSREEFYSETFMYNELGIETGNSPDCSTVVIDESNKCVGFLLCGKDGRINGIRATKAEGISPLNLMRILLGRSAGFLYSQGIRQLNTSCFAKDRKQLKYLKACGFWEMDEYPVWGWSKYL